MPCTPNDVSINLPDGPSGPSIPGFGTPFALKLPDTIKFPAGVPEDLLDILNKLQLLIPPGALKPALNPNFGKDIFDGIMKLMDQFFPFLMLYKFFLPILELIICIIEVLCAISNPFKLIRAIKRLFLKCLPTFLNLFPVFALIIMLISLLLLLLALIEYIIEQIKKFIEAILRNLKNLQKAFQDGDENSVLAIAKKLGSLLCIFQNLFVLLSLFATIIDIIKNILSLSFSIPPCDDDNNGNSDDSCCDSTVCPDIVKNNYTRTTGTLQYLNKVVAQNVIPGLPGGFNNLELTMREESLQLFDFQQDQDQAFSNIFDAFDITSSSKPVFFPTDVNYNSQTTPKQAAYTIDLRLFYDPLLWGRVGNARYIRFTDCIVTKVPVRELNLYNNSTQIINNAVVTLVGGKGFEDDLKTILTGFAQDGITSISNQATIENFIHKGTIFNSAPSLSETDGYSFENMEYTFKPNIATLINKQLVTLGCEPSVALTKAFVNNAFAGDIAIKIGLLGNLLNGDGSNNPNSGGAGNGFPDINGAIDCLSTAVSGLRANMTNEGVAQFQAITDVCLNKLKSDTNQALGSLIGIGFEPCKSSFNLNPNLQFTSKEIKVSVNINERNGLSIISGLSNDISDNIASRIKAYNTFGEISDFIYDGYGVFEAFIKSSDPGEGQLMISFDNNIFCTNTIPENVDQSPTHDLQVLNYQFVYTPVSTNSGDSSNIRRDEGDISRDGK